MVSEKATLSAGIEAGLRVVIVGEGGLMAKIATGETPPVVVTVMLTVLTEVSRLAGTAAVNNVGLT
jgi:hypothetical protein